LLLKIAAAFNAPFDQATQAVYLEAFNNLDDQSADQMYNYAIRNWSNPSQMPTIKFLLEATTRTTVRGKQQWLLVVEIFRQWHPDTGISPEAPKLHAAGDYAFRLIGGVRGLAASKIDHEGFIRDRFLEAYRRFHEEGGEQTHFTQQFSERLLKQLQQARSMQLTAGEGSASSI